MRRIIITLMLVISSFSLFAQTTRNFAWYNQFTYDLYEKKEWNKLIKEGHLAIKAGYDFHYLRMRIGIAYYEQEQYRLAIAEFEKALKFNDGDPLTVEYLYYSYKLSGRVLDANIIYTKYKKQLQGRKVPSSIGFIKSIYTELGLKMISPSTPDYGTLKYAHIGIEHQLGSRINIYHGFARLSQNQYETTSSQGFRSFTTQTKYVQNEYYLKATMPIIKGLQLKGSLHTQSVIDSIEYSNLAFSAGLNTSIKSLDLFASYGSANINDSTHTQFSIGTTFYTQKNQNVYFKSIFTYHIHEDNGNLIFYEKVGLRTGKNTWFEFHGAFGDMRNVQEEDGFYIYNVTDNLETKLGVSTIFFLSKNTKLFIGYTAESLKVSDTQLPYKRHYIFTGLQFNLKN